MCMPLSGNKFGAFQTHLGAISGTGGFSKGIVSRSTCLCDSDHGMRVRCFLLLAKEMVPTTKLVAMTLAAVMLVFPALALGLCHQGMTVMSTPDEHLSMTGMPAAPNSFTVHASNECCEVTPIESAAPSFVRTPANNATGAPLILAADIEFPQLAKGTMRSGLRRAPSSPPRALLCVFLI